MNGDTYEVDTVLESVLEEDGRDPTEIMEDAADLYERKNADYGDSWRLVGKTIALWLDHQGEDKITIPADSAHLNDFGLLYRRLDKTIRQFNGTYVVDEMEVDESVAETAEDDVPYAAMHAALVEEMVSDER